MPFNDFRNSSYDKVPSNIIMILTLFMFFLLSLLLFTLSYVKLFWFSEQTSHESWHYLLCYFRPDLETAVSSFHVLHTNKIFEPRIEGVLTLPVLFVMKLQYFVSRTIYSITEIGQFCTVFNRDEKGDCGVVVKKQSLMYRERNRGENIQICEALVRIVQVPEIHFQYYIY